MQRASRYFSRGGPNQATLNTLPAYVLARIKGEALALHAARPENSWLRDQACVVIGYVEAFPFYREGEFPWGHVAARLQRMRDIIAKAERLAWRVNMGAIISTPRRRNAPARKPDREIRYDGRWVSRIWYARNVKHAQAA